MKRSLSITLSRSLRSLAPIVLATLALTGCPKKQDLATTGTDATTDAAPSASVATSATPAVTSYPVPSDYKPSPLSSARPLEAPSVLPVAGLDGGASGTRVLYAQKNDPGDIVKLVGVDRASMIALLATKRNNSEAPPQLVTVDLAKGKLVEAWSPSHALQATARLTNPLGPKLADALDAGPSLRADLAGWASRLARVGPPWADDLLSTAPNAKHIVFLAAFSTWETGPDGANAREIGTLGHARLSPDGEHAAWAGHADLNAPTQTPQKIMFVDLASTARAAEISTLVGPGDIVWSNDSKTAYVVTGDGCVHALDAATRSAKQLACEKTGREHGLVVSPDGRSAVLYGHTPDPFKLYTDLVFLSLPDGAVKKEMRIPVEARGAILDDAGLLVVSGYNHGTFLVAIDLPGGKTKIALDSRDSLHLGGFVGPRSFVGLRSPQGRVEVDELLVEALAAAPPDKMPEDRHPR